MDQDLKDMIAEQDALQQKSNKMVMITQTPEYVGMTQTQKALMLAQTSAMSSYLNILNVRILLASN